MLSIIANILLLSVAIIIVAQLLPGMRIKNIGTGLEVAIGYSVINFLLFKIIVWLSFPFVLFSFGLFVLVINGFLLWLTNALMDDFELDGCGTAVFASLLISVFNVILKMIF